MDYMEQVARGRKVTQAAVVRACKVEDYMVLNFISEDMCLDMINKGFISEDCYSYQQDAIEEMNYLMKEFI